MIMLGVGFSWYANIQQEKKADEWLAQAQDNYRTNNLSQGLVNIDKALAIKEKPEYLKVKLNILYNQNKVSETKLVLTKLIQFEPTNPHYYYLRGLMAFNEENLAEALQDMSKAAELKPDNLFYLLQKAILLSDLQKNDESTQLFEKLLKLDPKNYDVWDQYSIALYDNGFTDKAFAIRKRGLEAFPKNFMHHFGMANLLDETGRKQEAVEAYKQSLMLHPLEDSIAAKRIYEITGKRVPPEWENLTSDAVPFESQGNVMFVTADVNGEKGRFLVDTGASFAIIFKSKVDKFKVKLLPVVIPIQTANGFIQASIAYGDLQLGKYNMNDVKFAVSPDLSDNSVDGVIGMNVLNDFKFEIDQASHEIRLKR
jgi:clan AA aspartic protease (TIGR02281 family)